MKGNYTLLFGKENIIVGCDLALFQSGKGLWEVIGGGKNLLFQANRKILNVHGFHLVCWDHFTFQSRGVVVFCTSCK